MRYKIIKWGSDQVAFSHNLQRSKRVLRCFDSAQISLDILLAELIINTVSVC